MRTATVNILGEDRLLCLSTRAKCDIDDRFGDLERAFDRLSNTEGRELLSTVYELLEIMMEAGATYARKTGLPYAEPLKADDLFDLVGVGELPGLVAALRSAIVNGTRRDVEAIPPKNSKTTPPQT